jgi:hypothetical protein
LHIPFPAFVFCLRVVLFFNIYFVFKYKDSVFHLF